MEKFFTPKPRYAPLHDDYSLNNLSAAEEEAATIKAEYTKQPRISLPRRMLYALLAIILGLATLDSITHRIVQIKSLGTAIDKCVCEGPPTSAKANGCVWDDIEIAWVKNSTNCVDLELLEEYSKAGPGPHGEWTYFAIENGQHVNLTVEEASLKLVPDSEIYITYENHVVHCIYGWRKLWRSQHLHTGARRLDNDDEHHIKHCGMVALERTDLQRVNTRVKYSGPKFIKEEKENPYQQANHQETHEHPEDKQY